MHNLPPFTLEISNASMGVISFHPQDSHVYDAAGHMLALSTVVFVMQTEKTLRCLEA
jgi:hypothetical protein